MPPRRRPAKFKVRYEQAVSEGESMEAFSIEGPGLDGTIARGHEIAAFIEKALNAAHAAFGPRKA